MRIIFTLLFLVSVIFAKSQLLTGSPAFIRESSDPIKIIIGAKIRDQVLKAYSPFKGFMQINSCKGDCSSNYIRLVPVDISNLFKGRYILKVEIRQKISILQFVLQ